MTAAIWLWVLLRLSTPPALIAANTTSLDKGSSRMVSFKNGGRELLYVTPDGVVHVAEGVTTRDIAKAWRMAAGKCR